MDRIGVIGLGRMGSAIAERMQAQCNSVLGWTRSARTIKGVLSTPDVRSLVQESDVLILSLFDDDAVAEILDTLLTYDLSGKLIIETSTVVPAILTTRIAAIEKAGAMAVDAPISGGPELVRAGACGVFVGGTEAAAGRASDVLVGISGRVFHVGPLGTGLVMKTINNAMLQIYFSGLTELMPLAKRAGLPMDTALRIVTGGPAGIPMVKDRLPRMLGEDESVGFTNLAVMKDNHVFQRVAASYGVSAPSLKAFGDQQRRAIEAGLGDKDPAALVPFAYDAE